MEVSVPRVTCTNTSEGGGSGEAYHFVTQCSSQEALWIEYLEPTHLMFVEQSKSSQFADCGTRASSSAEFRRRPDQSHQKAQKLDRKRQGGDHLAQSRLHAVLQDGPGAAATVAPVLQPEPARRRAHHVVGTQAGIEPDPTARKSEPVIVFGVFVVREGRVVAPDVPEPLDPEAGVVAVIDPAGFGPATVGGAPGARLAGHLPRRLSSRMALLDLDKGQCTDAKFKFMTGEGRFNWLNFCDHIEKARAKQWSEAARLKSAKMFADGQDFH